MRARPNCRANPYPWHKGQLPAERRQGRSTSTRFNTRGETPKEINPTRTRRTKNRRQASATSSEQDDVTCGRTSTFLSGAMAFKFTRGTPRYTRSCNPSPAPFSPRVTARHRVWLSARTAYIIVHGTCRVCHGGHKARRKKASNQRCCARSMTNGFVFQPENLQHQHLLQHGFAHSSASS